MNNFFINEEIKTLLIYDKMSVKKATDVLEFSKYLTEKINYNLKKH